MDIQPIRSDEDHRAALAEIEACWGAREGTERGDKLEVLVALVESYEARRWPTGRDVKFDPIDTLQYAIDELEKEKRGLYAGCVGYFSAGGEMDTCIALRTALIKGGVIYVQAGAGIVADSDPAAEQQECVNKAKALFRAAEEARRFASLGRRGQ